MKKLFKTSPCSRVIASTLGCVAISFPLFLTACGDETTNVTETTGMTLVEKGAKMPDCTADNAGQMVYSTDSVAAFFCADGKWQSLKGEKGEKGDQGEQGEPGEGKQGPKGEDGTGTKGDPGAAGKSCTAQKLTSGDGYKIVCGGDSVGVVLDGVGTPGVAGESCTAVASANGYDIMCGGVKKGEVLNGDNGTSCSATQVTGGVQISCTDGTSVTLNDGAKGADGKSFIDGWMVDSRDKQLYRTVTIGNQIWMAENLNYATEVNGSDSSSFCYGDNGTTDRGSANCAKYGRLYTWAAAVGMSESDCGYGHGCTMLGASAVQGVCPSGWHLPSEAEWKTLLATVDENLTGYGYNKNVAGKALKSKIGWSLSSGITNDDTYAFSALAAGNKNVNDEYTFEGSSARFWSFTEYNASLASYLSMSGSSNSAYTSNDSKNNGYSVRCIKDAE